MQEARPNLYILVYDASMLLRRHCAPEISPVCFDAGHRCYIRMDKISIATRCTSAAISASFYGSASTLMPPMPRHYIHKYSLRFIFLSSAGDVAFDV